MDEEELDMIHAGIQLRIVKSLPTVMEFVMHLVVQNIDVKVLGLKLAERRQDRFEAMDPGYDVIARGKKIDVKKLSRDFTSAQELADSVKRDPMTCEEHLYGTADKYVMWNRLMTGYITVDANTSDQWYIKEAFNSLNKKERRYYHAPVELWTYHENAFLKKLNELEEKANDRPIPAGATDH